MRQISNLFDDFSLSLSLPCGSSSFRHFKNHLWSSQVRAACSYCLSAPPALVCAVKDVLSENRGKFSLALPWAYKLFFFPLLLTGLSVFWLDCLHSSYVLGQSNWSKDEQHLNSYRVFPSFFFFTAQSEPPSFGSTVFWFCFLPTLDASLPLYKFLDIFFSGHVLLVFCSDTSVWIREAVTSHSPGVWATWDSLTSSDPSSEYRVRQTANPTDRWGLSYCPLLSSTQLLLPCGQGWVVTGYMSSGLRNQITKK